MVHTLRLLWLNVQNKQTKKCDMRRKYYIPLIQRLKVETTQTRTSQFYVKIDLGSETMECEWHATQFKSSWSGCVLMAWRNNNRIKVFTWQEITFILRGIVSQMPVYFDMHSNYTVYDIGAKFAVIRTSGSEKLWLLHWMSWQTTWDCHMWQWI